jgi:hypothetical protein
MVPRSYFRQSGAADEPSLQAEIDRYVNWPAQSLGYKIGQLKFIELRERARSKLGPNFDIRKYHEEVLDAGSLPLDLLEPRVDRWIEREKRLDIHHANSRVDIPNRLNRQFDVEAPSRVWFGDFVDFPHY